MVPQPHPQPYDSFGWNEFAGMPQYASSPLRPRRGCCVRSFVRIRHPCCNNSCTYLVSTNFPINLDSFPFSLRQPLLGSFIELASTVRSSEYITSIFNAHSHLEDSISLAPYLTRSAEHTAERQFLVPLPTHKDFPFRCPFPDSHVDICLQVYQYFQYTAFCSVD